MMEHLIRQTQPEGKIQQAQIRLLNGLQKRWKLYGPDLLHCYEISGLPPDNLKLESFFGRLRHHQRRISGRKSTASCLTSDKHKFFSLQPVCLNFSLKSERFPRIFTNAIVSA